MGTWNTLLAVLLLLALSIEIGFSKKLKGKKKQSTDLANERMSDEEKLFKALFKGYNPSSRPVMNSSKSVNVNVQFSLMHIKELDVKVQILTVTALLILEWRDERLQWKPREHNRIKEIIVESWQLWTPEMALIVGAEKIQADFSLFRAIVDHTGNIRWEPGGVFKTMCDIDITYYPFDIQRCEIVFGAWAYTTHKMNLTNSSSSINLDPYNINGEWEIAQTRVARHQFAYDCCPNQPFANIKITLLLKRRHTYYMMNVILPCILNSILLLSIFFCTAAQKMQIGVVVLLSFRIFLINVGENIPKSSDYIPILGIYLTSTMAITTLSMVLTVCVLNLHFKADTPVPPWLQTLAYRYIGRAVMCFDKMPEDVNTTARKRKKKKKQSITIAHSDRGHTEFDSMELAFRPEELRRFNHACASGTQEFVVVDPHVESSEPSSEEKNDYVKDWQKVAQIMDRFFFWVILLAIVISTLILFLPLSPLINPDGPHANLRL